MTGFGGSLVLAPALFAVLRPEEAVAVSVLLGVVQSGTMAIRGRHEILRDELRPLLLLALPGLVAGAFLLRIASAPALRVAVGVSVIVATLARRLLRPDAVASRRAAWPSGFLSGLLTTSVTVNGPPLVLYLAARGVTAAQMRATLAAVFVALDVVAVAPLASTGTLVVPPGTALLTLALAFPLGLLLGLRIGPRIGEQTYARAATVLLLALGAASIVAGLR